MVLRIAEALCRRELETQKTVWKTFDVDYDAEKTR